MIDVEYPRRLIASRCPEVSAGDLGALADADSVLSEIAAAIDAAFAAIQERMQAIERVLPR